MRNLLNAGKQNLSYDIAVKVWKEGPSWLKLPCGFLNLSAFITVIIYRKQSVTKSGIQFLFYRSEQT